MHARSLVGTAARLESYADATLALPVVTSEATGQNGWAFVYTLRELGEQLRTSAPVPYQPGKDRAVDESVATLIAELDGDSILSAEVLDDYELARCHHRVRRVGEYAVIPLSRVGPGVHNWPVVLNLLDLQLENTAEKLQRVRTRLDRADEPEPYAGLWKTADEMLEATRTVLQHLWSRQQTIAYSVDEVTDGPRQFGRWALENIGETDDA